MWGLGGMAQGFRVRDYADGRCRENILLGAPMDAERYGAVLEACALGPDLAALPRGDLARVGDRGARLSGGQRARVALARALYQVTPCHAVHCGGWLQETFQGVKHTSHLPQLARHAGPCVALLRECTQGVLSHLCQAFLMEYLHVQQFPATTLWLSPWRTAMAWALRLESVQERDVYLLDDVLAAVDAHVAGHLLRHALTGPLLAGKTRILVSHSPAAAAAADVLVLGTLDCFLGMPACCCQAWRLGCIMKLKSGLCAGQRSQMGTLLALRLQLPVLMAARKFL